MRPPKRVPDLVPKSLGKFLTETPKTLDRLLDVLSDGFHSLKIASLPGILLVAGHFGSHLPWHCGGGLAYGYKILPMVNRQDRLIYGSTFPPGMVRALNIMFDDEDYANLEAAKKRSGRTWREFVLTRCLGDED